MAAFVCLGCSMRHGRPARQGRGQAGLLRNILLPVWEDLWDGVQGAREECGENGGGGRGWGWGRTDWAEAQNQVYLALVVMIGTAYLPKPLHIGNDGKS